jgi:iron complex outermembrane recepter protein
VFCDEFTPSARAAGACVLILAGLWAPACAAGIAGRVTDTATEHPIAGVEVRLTEAQRLVVTGSDGRFEFADLAAGAYDVSFYRLGYQPAKRHIVVAASETATGVPLQVDVALQPLVFREEPIVVSATRVQKRESPVPYSNLSREDLDERYTTQDIPVLLSELPSAVYYSESGNGLGYNYLTLRGFDQRRLSVLINGVPQNDPEDQNIYWLDFPDLAANLQDVQVQRGAGSAFYGPPAIGGSVNLVTTVFQPTPGVRVQAGGGSFDTQKYSIEMNSGLVGGTYAFYGRYSRLLSDGYRRDSWVDFTSYFFGAARYDETMTTRIHVYGGPIADGLAFYGVPRDALHDRDARRQNPLAGGAQIENFSQPHYELLHEWQLDDTKKLSNTFFFVRGEGFFDYDASWADTTYYRLTEDYGFHPTANPGQSLIRAYVDNEQGGWLPRLDWKHDRGELSVGAELRIHRSLHWGKVRFAQNLPPELDPERTYYSYRGGKDIASLYGQEKLRLGSKLGVTGSLQLAYDRYKLDDEEFVGTRFDVPYFFANPRLGFNYNVTNHTHAYASYGFVQREPRLNNLYDAAESSGGATPQFAVLPGGGFDFDSPLVSPEKLHDIELGTGWRNDRLGADLNVFWMDFRDEIVKSGQLDRFGQPITGNAARSVHRGVELAAHAKPWEPLEMTGNLSWSLNQFRDHVVFEDANGDPVPGGLQLGGNSIAGFPDYIANLRGTFRNRGFVGSIAGRYVGPFFTTNYEEVDRKVPPYFALDADFSYDIGVRPLEHTRLRLQVRNLLDRLYVLNGEGDDFFPAATRNFFAGVEFGL